MALSSKCSCTATHEKASLIVITGGPGAGKTAILELARRHLCEHVAILPESAGIVFSGGFWRRTSLPARKASQRAIYHVQRELETIVTEERQASVGLCDRGTLDGLAYWPESEDSFWLELNTSREAEFEHYAAVIHLRTPSGNNGYNHQNPLRIESPFQAAEIDARILAAWDGHPKRFILESEQDFLQKAKKAIALIMAELPDCCRTQDFPEFSES